LGEFLDTMSFLKRKYKIERECNNCKEKTIVKIKKGITITKFEGDNKLNDGTKCKYCGCNPFELKENLGGY